MKYIISYILRIYYIIYIIKTIIHYSLKLDKGYHLKYLKYLDRYMYYLQQL